MSQLIYSPFNALSGLNRLARVFDESPDRPVSRDTANWVPRVDILEQDNSFLVQLDIPGVDPKSVDITVDHGVLTIEGSRSSSASDEARGYKRTERFAGKFSRQFTLPETADGSQIKAKANHGVLEISIPKTEKSQPLSIAVEG